MNIEYNTEVPLCMNIVDTLVTVQVNEKQCFIFNLNFPKNALFCAHKNIRMYLETKIVYTSTVFQIEVYIIES